MSSTKKTILLVGFFSLFVMYALSAVSAETDSSKTVIKKRPPVAFTHESHMGSYECLDCHHKYEGDSKENVLEEDELTEIEPEAIIMLDLPKVELNGIKCASCHNKDNKIVKSREAFHRQCIGCHEKESKGPVLCGECHLLSNHQASADE